MVVGDEGASAEQRADGDHGHGTAGEGDLGPAADAGGPHQRHRVGDAVGGFGDDSREDVAQLLFGHACSFIIADERSAFRARAVWLLTVPTVTPRASAVWASVRSS